MHAVALRWEPIGVTHEIPHVARVSRLVAVSLGLLSRQDSWPTGPRKGAAPVNQSLSLYRLIHGSNAATATVREVSSRMAKKTGPAHMAVS